MKSNFATKASLLFCILGLLFSCKKEGNTSKPNSLKGGVVLTFDDAYVKNWFEADKVLRKYSWKGTFCVSNLNTLPLAEINKLLALQNEGHEIAGHSLHHLNATRFVTRYGIDRYLRQEINPMLDLMHFYGLKVTSFAYPYGARSPEIDAYLLRQFQIIRGRDFGGQIPSKQDCYYNHSRIVFGFDIDNNHTYFSASYLLKLLEYAHKNNKILILCSHKTVNEATANYQTEIKLLEFICDYMKKHHMKFYTLSELYELK